MHKRYKKFKKRQAVREKNFNRFKKKLDKKTERFVISFGMIHDIIAIISLIVIYASVYEQVSIWVSLFILYMFFHIIGVLYEMMNDRFKYLMKDKTDLSYEIKRFFLPRKYPKR